RWMWCAGRSSAFLALDRSLAADADEQRDPGEGREPEPYERDEREPGGGGHVCGRRERRHRSFSRTRDSSHCTWAMTASIRSSPWRRASVASRAVTLPSASTAADVAKYSEDSFRIEAVCSLNVEARL